MVENVVDNQMSHKFHKNLHFGVSHFTDLIAWIEVIMEFFINDTECDEKKLSAFIIYLKFYSLYEVTFFANGSR